MSTEHENHSNIVVKSNALINAMCDLSLQGNRFLAFAISLLDRSLEPEKGVPVELEIPIKEYAETFNLTAKSVYTEIEALADQLQKKIITLESDQTISGARVKVGMLTKQKYLDSEGRVWVRFDEDLIPHMLGLKDHFTKYRIKDVYQFSKASTWRVYEILKQFKKVGKRTIDIEEFKLKTGVAGRYPRPTDLKRFVIDPAIEEMNETSDIKVQYEQNKRGRVVVSFTFHIIDNEDTKTKQESIRAKLDKSDSGTSNAPDLAKFLREEARMAPKQARQLANIAHMHKKTDEAIDIVQKLKKKYDALPDKRTSLGGWCFKILKRELTQGSLVSDE